MFQCKIENFMNNVNRTLVWIYMIISRIIFHYLTKIYMHVIHKNEENIQPRILQTWFIKCLICHIGWDIVEMLKFCCKLIWLYYRFVYMNEVSMNVDSLKLLQWMGLCNLSREYLSIFSKSKARKQYANTNYFSSYCWRH